MRGCGHWLASALDTLCQLLSDLVHTIKICTLVVLFNWCTKTNFANCKVIWCTHSKAAHCLFNWYTNANLHNDCSIGAQNKNLHTLCSIGAQNANSNTLWTKPANHLSNTGQQCDAQCQPHSLLKIDFSTLTIICRVSTKFGILRQGPTNKYETEV